MNDLKRTKIIATMGPAITGKIFTWAAFNDPKNKAIIEEAYKNMEQLFLNGVTCVRLNFSHGSHEEQEIRIKIAREVAQKMGRHIAIMLDTKGPEIRVGKVKDDEAPIHIGSLVDIFTLEEVVGDSTKFSVTDSTGKYNMAKDVKVKAIILVDDGKLQLEVLSVDINKGIIKTQALNNHSISEKRRINLPNTSYSLPFISQKDRDDIKFAVDHQLDYIALSFVNSAANLKEVRQILTDLNAPKSLQLIAKIESTEAIKNVDEIIAETNGIMVARGDLALEIPFYNIPYWEKYLIKACRFIGKPVIIATQMLDSLERNIQPTRAEVTDVFFAVDRGTDSTMLSGETAKGMFPIHAVKTMSIINVTAEKLFDYKRSIEIYFPNTTYPYFIKKVAKKIARKVLPTIRKGIPTFPNDFVVMFCNDQEQIWALANIHPAATIMVVTNNKEILKMFSINYGIEVFYKENLNDLSKNFMVYAKESLAIYQPRNPIVYYKNKFFKLM